MGSAGVGGGGKEEREESAVVGGCDKGSSPNEMASLVQERVG